MTDALAPAETVAAMGKASWKTGSPPPAVIAAPSPVPQAHGDNAKEDSPSSAPSILGQLWANMGTHGRQRNRRANPPVFARNANLTMKGLRKGFGKLKRS